MKHSKLALVFASCAVCFAAGIGHVQPALAQASAGGIDVSQLPLFTAAGQPPLNMLVMGKDSKNYYEAYNDASDLDGDGALDVGYKPASIDYYGYFNSYVCYTHDGGKFVPSSATTNKQCSGKWSGDFLNYVTTSRMDALRRVLYGGWRQTDSTTETILQGAYFPQDGHSWGKEYQSVARDGYDISAYTPLSAPTTGNYHLFAMTTLKGNDNTYASGYQAPVLRVLQNTDKRVWNWVSIEGPVAGNKCFTAGNARVDCVPSTSGSQPYPGTPGTEAAFDTLESTYAIVANRYGTGNLSAYFSASGINCNDSPACNVFSTTEQNQYLTVISGVLRVASADRDTYTFAVDGDDAVDFEILNSSTGALVARAEYLGDHGSCNCQTHTSAAVTLGKSSGNMDYTITFRHVENSGGAAFKLWWKKGSGPWVVVPMSSSGTGLRNDNNTVIATYDLTPAIPQNVSRQDYLVRVLSCPSDTGNATLRESSCKKYPNDQFKPTGILHDYGEASKMYFGLISGSQFDNLQGGVLRRNVSNFGDEINSDTGQFRTNVDGIANTISKFRMIGGGYNGSTTDNTNSDQNWNWNNGTGNCPSIGNRAIDNGECRMWGNPIAEMMYESMRYFAGAAGATPEFATGGASQGTTEETTMGLTKATWKDPYKAAADGGGGFLACSKPFETVISDINPSYDGDLPGSAFSDAVAPTGTTPGTISSFNAASEGQAIWSSEFGAGTKQVFIGDVAGATDGAPTVKTASSFGNIRGLSPEEPTKGGTYYSASVARFARTNDINAAEGQQNLATYSIALASPLPKIEFPIGDGKITLLPFAKTVSGTFGDSDTRKPTNTIVDFYVEKIVNLPNQPLDTTVNGGLPYAVFRINYEDVEQGNDHDMDAIVRYEIKANADNTVAVHLTSEYAAGSANQVMGYVLSGTTKDGVYLEVRDTDSPTCRYNTPAGTCMGGFKPYDLITPQGQDPGYCVGKTTDECGLVGVEATRTFTPSPANSGALQLNDPLWYAAKYGAPQLGSDDVDGDGVPDNYFLVTNPARLREQLDKAFQDIIANSQPSASVATSTPRYVPGSTLAYEASYKSLDWTGNLKAFSLRSDGTYNSAGAPVWVASDKISVAASRNTFTAKKTGTTWAGVNFSSTGLDAALKARLQSTLDTAAYPTDDLIAFLKGDQSKEQGATGCASATDCPFRKRSSRMGDILNSTPAVLGVSSLGYGSILADVAPTAAASYATFVQGKKAVYGDNSESPIIFVGVNDGMLHAIDGSAGTNGGTELFSYLPNGVLDDVHLLAVPGYVHHYYVDGSPTVGDAYLGGAWQTVLMGSLGAGGKGVYALNITDPRHFDTGDVMWEFNSGDDTDMGQFVGRPYIGLTDDGNWVAAFGNGYNSASQHAVLFIRDLETGAEIAKLDTGVGCLGTDTNCTTGPNGLATAVIVDNDGSGAGDTIYAGDYLGNVWRFEYVSGAWSIGNNGDPIFVATDPEGKRQSITSGAYTVANPLGGTMVVFGTGRYLNADDADETRRGLGTRASVDSVYGIWDSRMWDNTNSVWTDSWPIDGRVATNYPTLERQSITSYTSGTDGTGGYRTATRNPVDFKTSATDPNGKMGWWIDLACSACSGSSTGPDPLAGERVTASPQGILSDVLFNTFRPEGDSCLPGSQIAQLVFDALTGAASYTPIPPPGGWPSGQVPPTGVVGTDTGRGAPPGEPPIVIIHPPNPTVPPLCNPDDPDCNDSPPCDPSADPTCEAPVTSCSWRSPNPAGRPAGKLIPCGRISWKQLR
jgi:type IV pilus assembly protein PilY1